MRQYIREFVDLYKDLYSFIMTINETNAKVSDLNDLVAIKPELKHPIEVILNWVNSKDIVVEDSTNTASVAVVKTVTLPEVVTEPLKEEPSGTINDTEKLNRDLVDTICRYIAGSCDGLEVQTVVDKVVTTCPRINPRTLWRLVTKRTYAKISDTFYIIEDGIVKSVKETVLKESIPDYDVFMESLKDIDQKIYLPIFKNINESGGSFLEWIESDPNLKWEDVLIGLRVMKGLGEIGSHAYPHEFDVTVMIIDAIRNVGKRKTSRITTYINKKWGINPKAQHIYAVLNKSIYPDIIERFI